MTVEIEGIYLEALEKIANKYNKKTLEMWDKGKILYLRKKESALTILPSVILEYLRSEHPELYIEIAEELNGKIEDLKKHKSTSKELDFCLSQNIELKEEKLNKTYEK